jgi:Tfp pilus assembly protein PilN
MINLLPYQEKKLIKRTVTMRVLTTTLVVLTILVIVGGLLFLPTLMTINSRYGLAQSQIALLEREGVVTSTVNIADLEARTNMLENKFAATLPTSPILYIDTVRAEAGPGISLIGYTTSVDNEKKLEIQGITASREALQRFTAALEKNSKIASVDSPIANYVKSKDNQFTISVVFK